MSWVTFDIGGTRIKVAAFEDQNRVREDIIPANAHSPMIEKLNQLEQLVKSWIADGLSIPQGIGIASPGIVDRNAGRVLSINGKHEDAPDTDFNAWAKDTFHCPIVLLNDAIAAMVGEWQFGAGKGSNNIIMLTLGTGIGTAAIVDGQLLKGAGHFAGNLGGHLALDRTKTVQCNCNAYGCAEALASTWAHGESLKDLWQKAEQNDIEASKVVNDMIQTWALLIHNMILAYSPDRIVIGGGISSRGQILLEELKAQMPENIWYDAKTLDWRLASEPDYAGLLGALYMVSQS